jgi:hypothetical protein
MSIISAVHKVLHKAVNQSGRAVTRDAANTNVEQTGDTTGVKPGSLLLAVGVRMAFEKAVSPVVLNAGVMAAT